MNFNLYAFLLALLSLEKVRPSPYSASSAHYGASEEPSANSIWLLPKNYSQYVFSAPNNTLLGLTEDGLTVDALSLATKAISHTYRLPLPGYILTIGLDGTYATVVHNSYLSFITLSSTVVETLDFPYGHTPVMGLATDLSNEHESCGWAETWAPFAKIVCVNPSSRTNTKCNDTSGKYSFPISWAGTPDHTMVYGLTANGDSNIFKYVLSDSITPPVKAAQCPEYQYYRSPNWGNFYYPDRAWFSYDHTRIFFNNGLTLTASSDPPQDLQESGAFNNSFSPQYLYWIAQDSQAPYDVIVLRRVYITAQRATLHATVYTWPYLVAKADMEIPVPTTPAGLSVSASYGSRVYFNPTNNAEVYIVVNYTTGSYEIIPGIAFVDITA